MRPELSPIQKRRQSLLTVVLTMMGAAFLLFVMVLLTGGLFLYVIGVVGFIAFLCAFHYLVWGKTHVRGSGRRARRGATARIAAGDEWPRADEHRFQR